MIKVREVEDRDLLPLAEFLPRGFPLTTKDFWVQVFDFWWTSNPAYSPQIPKGWVLENDTTLVGFIGNIPNIVENIYQLNSQLWSLLTNNGAFIKRPK